VASTQKKSIVAQRIPAAARRKPCEAIVAEASMMVEMQGEEARKPTRTVVVKKGTAPDRRPSRPSSQHQPTETVLLISSISGLSFAISLRRSGNLMMRAAW
jgi:hypothetical protein